jgi:hypothetical protein
VNEVQQPVGEERRGSAAAAGGAPRDAAFRLDKRTHLDGAGYRASFIEYGDGLAEVSFGFASTPIVSKGIRGQSDNREENEDRAVRRARKLLRQKVLASGADHLLTLTYRDNVIEFVRASVDLSVFIRHVRRRFASYPYVAVAERQKRGAWHWHLAVCGWQDIKFLRATWRRVVGDGNIDVKAPRSSGGPRIGIVRYLCKYLGKSFGEEGALNARRFRSSRIAVPERRQMLEVQSANAARLYCENWLKETSPKVWEFTYCETWATGWGRTW